MVPAESMYCVYMCVHSQTEAKQITEVRGQNLIFQVIKIFVPNLDKIELPNINVVVYGSEYAWMRVVLA